MTDHRVHARRPDGRTMCGRARVRHIAEIEDIDCEACLRALPGMRAYRAEAYGVSAVYAAASFGQARIMSARALVDAGWHRTIGDALLVTRVRRAPEYDVDAAGYAQPSRVREAT